MTLENSPSNVAATDQLFLHFISMEAVVSAESEACDAPLTTKLAPGSAWKVTAALERAGLDVDAASDRVNEPVLLLVEKRHALDGDRSAAFESR